MNSKNQYGLERLFIPVFGIQTILLSKL